MVICAREQDLTTKTVSLRNQISTKATIFSSTGHHKPSQRRLHFEQKNQIEHIFIKFWTTLIEGHNQSPTKELIFMSRAQMYALIQRADTQEAA